jgi:hypothetical protein
MVVSNKVELAKKIKYAIEDMTEMKFIGIKLNP